MSDFLIGGGSVGALMRSHNWTSSPLGPPDEALTVVMELPGVEKQAIDVNVENDVFRVDARIDFAKYEGLEPLYTEYNVGHFARSFTLSNKVDRRRLVRSLMMAC